MNDTEKINNAVKCMKSLFSEILQQVNGLKGQVLKRKLNSLKRSGFDLNYENGFVYVQYTGFKSKKTDNYDIASFLSDSLEDSNKKQEKSKSVKTEESFDDNSFEDDLDDDLDEYEIESDYEDWKKRYHKYSDCDDYSDDYEDDLNDDYYKY